MPWVQDQLDRLRVSRERDSRISGTGQVVGDDAHV
jgi:hypothetical protein